MYHSFTSKSFYLSEIHQLEKFYPLDKSGWECWRGAYTLGVISKPVWLTVASQQVRAINLAKSLINSIEKDIAKGSKSSIDLRENINIAIIGGGIGGMTIGIFLSAINEIKKYARIDLFEKRGGLCPIQRGCTTRILHPTLQHWPDSKHSDFLRIGELASKDNYLEEWQAMSAGELASSIVNSFFQKFETHTKNKFNVYEGCSFINIEPGSRRTLSLSAIGKKIIHPSGETKNISLMENQYDIVIFATGFGVERSYYSEKLKIEIESLPYWRNDSFGQFNLNDKPHRYIISGNGDGAVSDALRILITDYNPCNILNSVVNIKFNDFKRLSRNLKSKETEQNFIKVMGAFFDKLDKLKTTQDTYAELLKLWNNDFSWKYKSSPFRMIYDCHISPRIKEKVEVIINLKSNSMGDIFNNPGVTFYNKFLFFMVWQSGKIMIESGDPADVAKNWHIPLDNVLIRHGADSAAPIVDSISNELKINFNEVYLSESKTFDQKIAAEREKYRHGKRITIYKKQISRKSLMQYRTILINYRARRSR